MTQQQYSRFENGIFELESINDKGLLSLYTWDGLLLFAPDEVEEVPKPSGHCKTMNFEIGKGLLCRSFSS